VRAKTNSSGLNLCCEADPKGKSQGCDLQRNSLQQEQNLKLVNALSYKSATKVTPQNNKNLCVLCALCGKKQLNNCVLCASAVSHVVIN